MVNTTLWSPQFSPLILLNGIWLRVCGTLDTDLAEWTESHRSGVTKGDREWIGQCVLSLRLTLSLYKVRGWGNHLFTYTVDWLHGVTVSSGWIIVHIEGDCHNRIALCMGPFLTIFFTIWRSLYLCTKRFSWHYFWLLIHLWFCIIVVLHI